MKLAPVHAAAATVVVAATLLTYWLVTDTPEVGIVGYAATWLWVVAVPGIVLKRLLLGARDSRLEDALLGVTLGMAAGVLVWLALTALGLMAVFPFWPVPVLAVGVWRRIRRRRSPAVARGSTQPEPGSGGTTRPGPVTWWLLGLALVIALGTVARSAFATATLPPAALRWYLDDYWQLALSAQLQHSVPPVLPQVAGTTFWYHWFSNAHIASLASTGVALDVLVVRLWMPAAVLAALGMFVVVGRRLTGAYWPGALAALCAAFGAAIYPSWFGLFGPDPFNAHSPSQQFALSITLLALLQLIVLLQDRRLSPGGWAVLGVALIVCGGAKASVLPVLMCGMLATAAMCLLVLRSHLKPTVLGLAATIGAQIACLPLSSGGSSGVTLQFFSTVRFSAPWVALEGLDRLSQDLIIPGLHRQGAVLLLALILLSYLLAYGFVWVSAPTWRANPAAWLLVGTGIAGASAMMLLNQDGVSQVYFFSGAVIAWHLLAALGAHHYWTHACGRAGQAASAATVLTGAALGAAAVLGIRELATEPNTNEALNSSILTGVGTWLALCAAVLVVAAVWRRGRPLVLLGFAAGQFGAALPLIKVFPETPVADLRLGYLLTAAIGAVALAMVLWRSRRNPVPLVRQLPPVGNLLIPLPVLVLTVVVAIVGVQLVRDLMAEPVTAQASTVTRAELTAARWLRDHSAVDDIVATNLHCTDKRTEPNCEARSFWVGAFTERAVLVEGWAYTAQAHEAHGRNGLMYSRQPFHDPDLLAVNEAAFYDPTVEGLDRMRDLGVTWLFADKYAGTFSASLRTHADLVYENEDVHIYRLR